MDIISKTGSKVTKTSNGHLLELSKDDWLSIGSKAGWVKEGQTTEGLLYEKEQMPFSSSFEDFQRGDVIINKTSPGYIYIVTEVLEPSGFSGAVPGVKAIVGEVSKQNTVFSGMGRGTREEKKFMKIGDVDLSMIN